MLSRGPGQSRFTLAVLLVISITVIALDVLGLGPFGFIRDGVNGALSPFRSAGNAVFGDDDSDEVAELEQRVAELEGNEIEAANYLAELRRLQAALNLDVPRDIDSIAATVTSRNVGNFVDTWEIDKGANEGIEVNMPVTLGSELVGVVDSVTFTSARISLITQPDVRVGVRLAAGEEGEVGVARGQGEGQPLEISDGFSADVDVREGDPFVTDGPAGSHFPPGLVVGRAVSVAAADNPLERLVYIEPAADLDGLSQVAVLLFTPREAGPEQASPTTTAPTGGGG